MTQVEIEMQKLLPEIGSFLNYETAEALKNCPDEDLHYMFHYGLGMTLRNKYLWHGGDLCDAFHAEGINEVDDMSHLMIMYLKKALQQGTMVIHKRRGRPRKER